MKNRSQVVQVRVFEAERAMFITNAALHGMSLSSWARLALLKQAAHSSEALEVQTPPSSPIKPGDVITADLGHGLVEFKILSLNGHKEPK